MNLMNLKTLVRIAGNLQIAELEMSLTPGLPKIEFLGLADQTIRESELRIKSAIKSSGFEFPRARQIIINIKPNDCKKSSRGLELAVALGILIITEQVTYPISENEIIYGELSLDGQVSEPNDLHQFFSLNRKMVVLTGNGAQSSFYHRKRISSLNQIMYPDFVPFDKNYFSIKRPQEGIDRSYNRQQKKIIELVSVGCHSAMLAGPSGVGKTTVAKSIPSFLSIPSETEVIEILKWNSEKYLERDLWRPLVSPHHSSTPLSVIGGGSVPQAGEITKAHCGVLLLDEYLEFASKVQEMLREPMQEKKIRIARSGGVEEFPAHCIYLATTNLCPCGKWLPKGDYQCERSALRCRAYRERLVGPVLDRFELLFFVQKEMDARQFSGQEILEEVEKVRDFKSKRQTKNIPLPKIEKWLGSELIQSERRRNSIGAVSRTLADLDYSEEVLPQHIDEALNYAWRTFTYLNGPI